MEEQKLLKRKRKALSEGNKDAIASVCIDLAELYMNNGEYEDAVSEYKEVAVIYKDANKILDYAFANRMIGEAYTNLREYKKALGFQQIYLDISKQQNNKLEQQRALATIGHTYLTSYLDNNENSNKEALNLAYKSFMKSLVICESLTGISKREHMDMSARLFANLGIVQECLGNFDKGIELVKKSINICKNYDIYEQLERGYTSLSTLYIKKEMHREAIQNINLAVEVAKRLDNKINLMCSSYLAKSDILIKLDDFQGAKSTLLKAYKLKTTNIIDKETIQNNLKVIAAICYTQDSLLTTSDTDYKKIKGLYEKLGDACCLLKNYKKALEYYEKMLEACTKFSSEKIDLSPCFVSLAQTYFDCKNYMKAVEYFKKDYEVCKDNKRDGFEKNRIDCVTSLLSIVNTMELSDDFAFDEVKAVYLQAENEAEGDSQLLGKVLQSFLKFLQKYKSAQVDEIQAKLNSLNFVEMDSGSEDMEDELNTPNVGDDICIDEITDESACSDNETDLNKPRVARKRTKGLTVKRNNKGETQLHTACISGNLTLVQRLIDQGHPVNIRDHCGWLPIHEACICGHNQIVEILLDKGAYINDRGGTHCNGTTPLHDACSNGHLPVIQLLLDRNASSVAKTDDGDTPLSILQNWRQNVKLDETELAMYENIIERLTYALKKSGGKIENVVNKENIALVYENNTHSSKNKLLKHKSEKTKKSPAKNKMAASTTNLRRKVIDLTDSDSDNSVNVGRGVKRNEISSESDSSSSSSNGESDKNSVGLEYKKVMANLRNRNFENSAKKQKKGDKNKKLPALVRADEFVDDDWLDDDLNNIKKAKKQKRSSFENLFDSDSNQSFTNETSRNIYERNQSFYEQSQSSYENSQRINEKTIEKSQRTNEKTYKTHDNKTKSYKTNENLYKTNDKFKTNENLYKTNENLNKTNENLYKANENAYKTSESLYKTNEKQYSYEKEQFTMEKSQNLNKKAEKVNETLHNFDFADFVHLSDSDDFQDVSSSLTNKIPKRKKQMSLIKAGFTRRKSSSSPTSFKSISPIINKNKHKQQTKLTDFNKHVRNLVAEADSTSNFGNLVNSQRNFSRKPSNTNLQTQNNLETTLSVDVRIDGKLYRVPISLNDVKTRNIEWLAEEASKRYCKKECIKPTLELECVNGAVLADDDLISVLFPFGALVAEEVHAKIVKWNVPLLIDRYKENCSSMAIEPMEDICKILQEASTTLDLSNLVTRGKLAPLCKAINRQNNLQILNLSGNFLDNENMQILALSIPSLDNLTELNLSLNNINTTGMQYLTESIEKHSESLKNLISINLNHNPLNNTVLKQLHILTNQLKQLKRLEIADINIDNNLFANNNCELNLNNLIHFNISYNNLDETSLVKIINWLNASKIEYLDVSSNCLNENNTFITEFINLFNENDKLNLKNLNLSRLNITDSDVYELLRCLLKTTFMDCLNLSFNENLTAISLRRLLQHSSLFKSLNLTGCVNILKYFDDCTDSLFNILEETGRKLENLKLSVDYLENVNVCNFLIDMWKSQHPDNYSVFSELQNYLELSKSDVK